MKIFCADRFDAEVVEVECEKKTDSYVWINGRRNSKVSDYRSYYDTEIEAWLHLHKTYTISVSVRTKELEKSLLLIKKCEDAIAIENSKARK
jgi:hypothetical protein